MLHLLLQQKPRRVVFPALRFLVARQQTNHRRMQVRHWLLLLLRIGVILAIVLALARPRLMGNALGAAVDQPVVAVFVMDTSPSMSYGPGGVTRLDRACMRAQELLDDFPPSSRVAIVDASEILQEPFVSVNDARARLQKLSIRPSGGTINRAVERACDLLHQNLLNGKDGNEAGPPSHLLLIFTDATRGAWDPHGPSPHLPEGVRPLLFDLGVARPHNLGIEAVELVPANVVPGRRFEARVRLLGTPNGHENELIAQLGDGTPERQPVVLVSGQKETTVSFDLMAPREPGPYPLTFQLAARDELKADDVRYAVLTVRRKARMLTLRQGESTRLWELAIDSLGAFENTVRTIDESERETFSDYSVIALGHLPRVPGTLWHRLQTFVREGGGLAILPAGNEATLDDYRDPRLMPAPLERLAELPPDQPLYWRRFVGGHPLLEPFAAWSREANPDFAQDNLRPFVRRYWQLGPLTKGATVVAAYENNQPALVERLEGRGRVLLFTTPLDARRLEATRLDQWTNYWQYSSFGLVLIDRSTRYLAGETAVSQTSFRCGVEPSVRVPSPLLPPYRIEGPGLSNSELDVKPPTASGELTLPQARQPGVYVVRDGRQQAVAAVSLNIAGMESDLTPIEAEEWAAVFGPNAVVRPESNANLREVLAAGSAPQELLPYLLLILVVILTLEGLFANRFYGPNAVTTREAQAA
ncbi:MAG: BatA and WFA domain-containing protein [Gemmataceae bacterium]